MVIACFNCPWASMAVKPFIMDNAVVVGVGNIYATERCLRRGSIRVARRAAFRERVI